jgi:hypothetical protein
VAADFSPQRPSFVTAARFSLRISADIPSFPTHAPQRCLDIARPLPSKSTATCKPDVECYARVARVETVPKLPESELRAVSPTLTRNVRRRQAVQLASGQAR